jgi:hypothetical protein
VRIALGQIAGSGPCPIGANLSTREAACLRELAYSPTRPLVEVPGEQGACVAQHGDGDGQ